MTKLTGFDGVRALACLMVIFHHIAQRMDPNFIPGWLSPILGFLIEGGVGVSVFFVLSGALLAYPFWRAFINNEKIPTAKVYFIRRFSRIAPGYYLSMSVSFLLAIWVFDITFNNELIIRYVSGLFFLSAFHPITLFPVEVNGPLWSISFEVVSYVFMYIMMFCLFKLIKNRSFSDALYFCVFVVFLSIMLHIIIYKNSPIINELRGWQHGLMGGAKMWMPIYNVVSLFSHFLFGIIASALMTFLFSKKQEKNKGFDYFILFNWVLFFVYAYFMRGDTFLNIPYYWPFFPMLIGITLICLPFTISVGRLLDNRFFMFTAKISFGLYIWHFVVMALLQNYFFEQYEGGRTTSLVVFFAASGLTFLLTYIIATLSFYLIDQPAQKWSYKFK